MPGMERLSISEAVAEVTEIAAAGVRAVLLFGIPASKDEVGWRPTTTRASSRWPSAR